MNQLISLRVKQQAQRIVAATLLTMLLLVPSLAPAQAPSDTEGVPLHRRSVARRQAFPISKGSTSTAPADPTTGSSSASRPF